MPRITPYGFVHFPLMSLSTVFEIFSPGRLQPLRAFPLEEFVPLLCFCGFGLERTVVLIFYVFLIVAETTSVSSCALSFRFPLIALSLLPFNADRFPFTSFHWYTCCISFVAGLKVSDSDLLIHASLCHGFQLLIVPLWEMLLGFLFVCLKNRVLILWSIHFFTMVINFW